jgi:hypothetical protein
MSNGRKSFHHKSYMGHPEDGWMSKARSHWIAGKGWNIGPIHRKAHQMKSYSLRQGWTNLEPDLASER